MLCCVIVEHPVAVEFMPTGNWGELEDKLLVLKLMLGCMTMGLKIATGFTCMENCGGFEGVSKVVLFKDSSSNVYGTNNSTLLTGIW